MKKLAFLLLPFALLFFIFQTTTATPSDPDAPTAVPAIQVVRAYFDDPALLAELSGRIDVWYVAADKGYIETAVNAADQQWLQTLGFRIEVDAALTDRYTQPPKRLPGQVNGIPGYACYRTVEETFASAQQMTVDYPQLASWSDVGDSWEKTAVGGNPGYDLQVLKLTNAVIPGPKPVLFAISALHAREYATAELMTRFAEYLLTNYGHDADATWLLDYHEIHLLLQANPDGRKQAETGLYWRKNTNQNYCGPTSTSRGADLNRNFEFQWGGTGSSGDPCAYDYRGPAPASEPETGTVQAYARSVFPDQRPSDTTTPAPDDATGVFLDIHSYGRLVLWPWGYTGAAAPNSSQLQTLGRKMAYFNGYEPDQAIGLYPTDGTTDDFHYGDLGVAAYTFEIGTTFFQSCSYFENTLLPENLPALLTAAKAARAPFQLPAGPDVVAPALSASIVTSGTLVTLTVTLDDTRFNNSNGAEPTQGISGAVYRVDLPYWVTDTIPLTGTLTAVDGAFDSPVETAAAVIDTTGWTAERHTLFVQATDSAGNDGLVTAVFLQVVDGGLDPLITGLVRQAGSGEPITATVTAAGGTTTVADASGFYQMQVVSGTYDLTAVAPLHAPQTVSDVVAADWQTVVQDFTLYPLCTLWSDDAESGVGGWTADIPWGLTTAQSHSPSHAWSDSPGGPYANNSDVALTSPPFDFSDNSGIRLSFWQQCVTEVDADYCVVEASPDGGSNWTELARFDGSQPWQKVTLAAGMLDGAAQARIRFRLESDGAVAADGWYVDDVALVGTGPACTPTPVPVTATLTAGSVQLGWRHMSVNGSYAVYRGSTPYFTTVGATPVMTLTAPTAVYSSSVGVGDAATSTFYVLRSLLASNGLGANSNRVGEVEFVLNEE